MSLLLRLYDPTVKLQPLGTPNPRIVGNAPDRTLQYTVWLTNSEKTVLTIAGVELHGRLATIKQISPLPDLSIQPGMNTAISPNPSPTALRNCIPFDLPNGDYPLSADVVAGGQTLASTAIVVRVTDTDLDLVRDGQIVTAPDTNADAVILGEIKVNTEELNGLKTEVAAKQTRITFLEKRIPALEAIPKASA